MARVLIVGLDPADVDYSDPALPPGLNAEAVHRAIASGLEETRAAGHTAQHINISAGTAGLNALTERLAAEPVDCVVIGGGVRLPAGNLILFEAVLNIVGRATARPVIAFPARPDDLAAAIARVLVH